MDLARATVRPSAGAILAAAGGVLLVASMFGDWYTIDVSGGRVPGAEQLAREASVNAWQAFAWIDMLLFAAAVFAVFYALFGASARLSPRLVLAAGAVAAGAIAYRLGDPPLVGGQVFTFTVHVSPRAAAFLGLLGALMIVAGGLRISRSSD